MILIADSGSTKTDWKIISGKTTTHSLQTKGLNPLLTPESELQEIISLYFGDLENVNNIENVFFYGAGCSGENEIIKLKKIIQNIFVRAHIEVQSDMLAAARATCKNKTGIACILGTGSNSCLYDGKIIAEQIPSLGFILGDEGSGSYLGKLIIKKYFYKELPFDLEVLFKSKFQLSREALLNNVYKQPNANVFLAGFASFYSENKTHPFIQQLIFQAFDEFFKAHIVKYTNYTKYPVHFVGSIGATFNDILLEVANKNQTQLGLCIKQPIDELVEYHVN
jgi:glucosamine kinase